jgi:hypothetical protein
MTVFLAGADLFRDEAVHSLLDVLLTLYARGGPVDFGDVPGVAFVDLYTAFVYHVCLVLLLAMVWRPPIRQGGGSSINKGRMAPQYGGVSFGDRVYQRYLVLPLVQRAGYVMFRTLLWDECIDSLASLSLAADDLPLPVDKYAHVSWASASTHDHR